MGWRSLQGWAANRYVGENRRKRAEVVRALVENIHEREAKELMLRIAREYEDLAKLTEQRADGSQQRHTPAQGDSTNNLAG
jgi:hypothetical protein